MTVLTVKISPFLRFLKAQGISTSAEVDLGLLALRTIDNFPFEEAPLTSFDEYEISTKSKIREITEKLLKEFLLWVLRQAQRQPKLSYMYNLGTLFETAHKSS